MFFPSDSQCNDAVACLTDVENPSDISDGVHCLNCVVVLILNLIAMKKTHYLLNTPIQTDTHI